MSDIIDSNELSTGDTKMEIDWVRCIPFYLLHLSVVSVFFVEFSWMAIIMMVAMYFPRMFGLTGFYHRYFAHRAYKTSRWFQFVGAVLGGAAIQRGALW
ncbi:MAG: acyl-CoA desaturase, partial [Planctomycetaceae bacterium]|nr:acyl-CoA desaturase [Planctomycetaceae bacterium]